jgi:multidrug efflux pump
MDKAVASVRDALSIVRGQLPRNAMEPSVYRSNRNSGIPFIILAFESETMNSRELSHFVNTTIKNAFRSINGVSSVHICGEEYITKIIVDPKKLHMFGINVNEVNAAINTENISKPVGKIKNTTPATLESKLESVEDFENVILKHQSSNGAKGKKFPVFLKDVATVELSSDDKNSRFLLDGKRGIFITINIAYDANPVKVSDLVQKEIKKLEKEMSTKVSICTILDNAELIRNSMKNTATAIVEAILLVLVIIFIFLRSVEATFIPIITIPISITGAFIFLKMFGFSINLMTLLGVVLSVGLVVDDAIIVLENILRRIEKGMSKTEASLEGAKEIGLAIVAMTSTLVSAYVPFAFVNGVIGQLFVEFAVALAGSVIISGFVALTLSPLMCFSILKRRGTNLFPQIDVLFHNFTKKYLVFLERMLNRDVTAVSIVLYSLIVTVIFLIVLPKEMIPKEDRGIVMVSMPTLKGKDINYYEDQSSKVSNFLKGTNDVRHCVSFIYESGGHIFMPLIEKAKRKMSANDIARDLYEKVKSFPSQDIHVWSEDSNLPGISNSEGASRVQIVISTNDTYQDLHKNLEKVRKEFLKNPIFEDPTHNLDLNSLVYKIYIDQNEASKVGIMKGQISDVLEVFFSGNRNLIFQKDGISYHVLIEGAEKPWDLTGIYITNATGKKISLDAVAKMIPSTEPSQFYHHNKMRSAILSFNVPKSENLFETLNKAIKILNNNLPQFYKKTPLGEAESIGKSYITMILLFLLAIIFIFAILSLQFNNFKDPLLILLTIPFACSGALFSVWTAGISLNIYTSVGLITLIGLITKHGILIVEFINRLMRQGESATNAVLSAAAIRLRPILMTTGAMFFGSIPLVISRDYGFESRECVGIVLTGGIFIGTIFILMVFPVLCNFFKNDILTKK